MTAEKMRDYLQGLPEQFNEMLQMKLNLPSRYKKEYQNILVSGLGGSAIGGDILRSYAFSQAAIPVIVNRDYDIPAFVGPQSLVLAVSYSGNTEETLSAYRQAERAGANIIVVSGGGKLSSLAREDGNMVVEIPAGLSPRAATGYLFCPLALILEELGLLSGVSKDLAETSRVLADLKEEINPAVDYDQNIARQLAGEMKGRIPVIWGSSAHSEVAAWRWKAQINENAKSPAYYNVFPELNHNELVGFEAPGDLISQILIVILRDPGDHERVKKRIDISRQVIESRVAKVMEVEARGNSFLARFYSLVYIGDYTSYYLALEYGINPTPVEVIDYLKAELNK
ncbi:Bifunctional glucose-6-phosphate/mannose-6-phosphate isomerase [Syntrophomonas zehnderi OL-4]|uniref:Bifunctional glucose-6-phosphate/mannose-6-phosphate isomerase n=2 Tax=Syntrophomonas TaxID=862 RepID=A0A0E4CKQ3_9FIRM|nr:Bifunctional glucose-6-phosphate/mannose-6-phosphate isomerase [Syntrophomonas zehnderi OL-4]